MRRAIQILCLMLAVGAGCGTPEDLTETEGALTHYPCGFAPVRSLDVTLTSGACIKYFVPTTADLSATYLINDFGGAFVTSVKTNDMAAAWVCDTVNPRGFSEGKYAPCWSGSVNNGVVRVRGTSTGNNYYAGATKNITAINGRSVVVSLATLPPPPWCYRMDAQNWAQIGPAGNADTGQNAYTGNNDPANGPGSQLTALWPDGATSGAPCGSNLTPTGYGEVYYSPQAISAQ